MRIVCSATPAHTGACLAGRNIPVDVRRLCGAGTCTGERGRTAAVGSVQSQRVIQACSHSHVGAERHCIGQVDRAGGLERGAGGLRRAEGGVGERQGGRCSGDRSCGRGGNAHAESVDQYRHAIVECLGDCIGMGAGWHGLAVDSAAPVGRGLRRGGEPALQGQKSVQIRTLAPAVCEGLKFTRHELCLADNGSNGTAKWKAWKNAD